ncbi:hypothetical protein HA399_10770 [Cobetia sp. UIB-001]|uniref:hypothetical protein n=1 Tax=Cobetia sp. UIB-001 TaxID=2717697 RepID=UPI00384A6CF3
MQNKESITIYYVVGQPRSGSTFVGDWLARRLNTINAGEVWQTFRSLKLVHDADFENSRGRWVQAEAREEKNKEINVNPFWNAVLLQDNTEPYSSLIKEAKNKSKSLVDTSKNDNGIAFYRSLGCKVVVIHTIRGFTTWARSMNKYQSEYGLNKISLARLLFNYIKFNTAFKRYNNSGEYYVIKQENLDNLNLDMKCFIDAQELGDNYIRCEMFGTPNFSSEYSKKRGQQEISKFDKLLYKLLGF